MKNSIARGATWRSDQRTVQLICAAGECVDPASQPTTLVFFFAGLCAAVRIAPARTARHRLGRGAVCDDPHASAKDRRADSSECAARLDFDGQQLSLARLV